MKRLVCLIITLFIVSSFKGQSIKIDTNKVYTLNTITKSKFISNEGNKTINLNAVFIDQKHTINNEGYKFKQYSPSNSEIFLGETCYWLVVALAIL